MDKLTITMWSIVVKDPSFIITFQTNLGWQNCKNTFPLSGFHSLIQVAYMLITW